METFSSGMRSDTVTGGEILSFPYHCLVSMGNKKLAENWATKTPAQSNTTPSAVSSSSKKALDFKVLQLLAHKCQIKMKFPSLLATFLSNSALHVFYSVFYH